MNVEVKIDENLHDVVSAAVLKTIDEGKRDALIQGAIKHLLTVEDGRDPKFACAPIERIFRDAVVRLAIELMKDEMDRPEVREKFTAVVRDATERALTQNREKTVEKIAEAINSAMYNGGRY